MTLDRNELKVQALLERVSSLTVEYENKVADLRVEVTLLSNQIQATQSEVEDGVSEEEVTTADTNSSE